MAGFGVSCYDVFYSQLWLLCFLQQSLYGVKKWVNCVKRCKHGTEYAAVISPEKYQFRFAKPTGFGEFGNKIPQFQLLVPRLQPTHTHQAKLTKQVSSHMPGYAIKREKYMLSQMSARLHIILHYCWLAFIQMYFSFYKETVFRCIDIWVFVMPLFVFLHVCECNLMNSEMEPLSMFGV